MDALASFLLAAFALTGSPGPNTLSAAAVGASFGRLNGLKYVTGLSAGVGLVILITGTGVSATILALPGIAPMITVCALIYFLYLAYKIATALPLNTPTQEASTAPTWYAGVFLSLANPKAYAAMAALFSGHALLHDNALADAAIKAALALIVVCIVNLLWLSVGAGLAQYLQNPRTSRMINVSFALLLLLSILAVTLG
ncbi:LysE family translocator [Roseovarius sp. EL26]|uniref:LysE family translocator n=1 Tax=Roseovarius sp. EL26 TaxID=2126672 RepID=UPI000EA2F321|nr:LysE family translocator [Roseovarius sp. EL26]